MAIEVSETNAVFEVTVNENVSPITVTVIEGNSGVSNHSTLNLDDGTNPHGTTPTDLGLETVSGGDFDGELALNKLSGTYYNDYDLATDGTITFSLAANPTIFGWAYLRVIGDNVTPLATLTNLNEVFDNLSSLPNDLILTDDTHIFTFYKTPSGATLEYGGIVTNGTDFTAPVQPTISAATVTSETLDMTFDIFSGDNITTNENLIFNIYGSADSYTTPIHTSGSVTSDADVSISGSDVTIVGVDVGTEEVFKVSVEDEAGNESIQSDLFNTGSSSINGVVLYYPLESNANAVVGSVNGVSENVVYTAVAGSVGATVASFNGNTATRIILPDADELSPWSPNNAFSIAMRFYLDVDTTSYFLVKPFVNGPANREIKILYSTSTGLQMELYDETNNGNLEITDTVTTYQTGQWYNLIFTWDGGTTGGSMTMNVDGVEVGTGSVSGTFVSIDNLGEDIYIGTANSLPLDGKLEELYVFNKVLSAQEKTDINTAWNAGNTLI